MDPLTNALGSVSLQQGPSLAANNVPSPAFESDTIISPGIITPPEDIIIIDPQGDLHHTARKSALEHRTYRVSSACFRLASTKWNANIHSARLSNVAEVREVETHSQFPNTVEILHHIAHSQFDRLSASLSFDTLHQLAVECHENDTRLLVTTSLSHWAWPWLGYVTQPGYERWLDVAFVFGYRRAFERATAHWAENLEISGSRAWVFQSHVNDQIRANILALRSDILTAMLNSCDDFIRAQTTVQCQCPDGASGERCGAMLLGSLLRGLNACSWWPARPTIASITASVDSMRGRLKQIQILHYHNHFDRGCSGASCPCQTNIRFHQCIDSARSTAYPGAAGDILTLDTDLLYHFETTPWADAYNEPDSDEMYDSTVVQENHRRTNMP